MTTRRFIPTAAAIAVLLSPFNPAQACGPDYEPDIFVNVASPDNKTAFADGQLGILQAGFDSGDYAVAYRYLNGGTLSPGERDAYNPPANPSQFQNLTNATPEQIAAARAEQQARQDAQPPRAWLLARAKYVPAIPQAEQTASFPTDYEGNVAFDENYLNCPDPAFQTAVLTLNHRADTWGKQSPWLADWIHAQDAVFSNCAGKAASMPAPVPANSPALLQADRAYQVAAATFYAKRFDEAAQQFEAIARDKNSPWSGWGKYLAARATVRKAFALGKATDPYSGDVASYDAETMRRAQQMLESLLAENSPTPTRATILRELNFIRIRTEPEKRIDEICAALAGPALDSNFAVDLADLNWVLVKHIPTPNPPPLLAWIDAWRGASSAATAYATWQRDHAQPWLIIAMAKAGASDPITPDLLAEAAKARPGTPAYSTLFYHRVRLLIALKRADEARALLDAALPALRRQPASSELNALLGQRMAVAGNFDEFLHYAPRVVLNQGSEGAFHQLAACDEAAQKNPPAEPCSLSGHPYGFDEDSTYIFNRQLPLDLLIQAATSPNLPPNLRQYLVLDAWTRSFILEDSQSAARLAPLLPLSIRKTAGSSTGFPAALAILRSPGIRPYLEPGIPRVSSFGQFDEVRDNWWNGTWRDNAAAITYSGNSATLKLDRIDTSAFLSNPQLTRGEADYKRIMLQPSAVVLIGQRVIDYTRRHPADPDVPEALHLVVRAGRYATADYDNKTEAAERTAVSKAAFQLLHTRYPKSPWTAKTPYYY